jgi:hypothetical protein
MVAAGWPSVGEALAEGSEGESTSWELIGWGDRRYGLSAAKSIYHSANAMALLGLGFASLLAVCLFHAVATCHGPRARFHRQYTHCKSLITCFSCLTFLFSCLAWGLFLYFPTALGNHCVRFIRQPNARFLLHRHHLYLRVLTHGGCCVQSATQVPKFTCDLFFGTASQTHHSPEDSIEVPFSSGLIPSWW